MVKRTLCFTNAAYLSTRHSQLVLQVPGAENSDDSPSVRTIPIEDIGVMILDNPQITLTPPRGKVGILAITDKQFGEIQLFYGAKERKPQSKVVQLEFF